MALKVKSAADAAAKFVANAQNAAPAYGKGVAGAGTTWQANTAAASENWKQGVQQAASQDRFAAGITNASQQKYQTRASGVGTQRYPTGVAQAGPAYTTAVQPYLTTLQNLTLPPRGVRGSPNNIQRVAVIAAALRGQKLGNNS